MGSDLILEGSENDVQIHYDIFFIVFCTDIYVHLNDQLICS